jgi:hypothetical protein
MGGISLWPQSMTSVIPMTSQHKAVMLPSHIARPVVSSGLVHDVLQELTLRGESPHLLRRHFEDERCAVCEQYQTKERNIQTYPLILRVNVVPHSPVDFMSTQPRCKARSRVFTDCGTVSILAKHTFQPAQSSICQRMGSLRAISCALSSHQN